MRYTKIILIVLFLLVGGLFAVTTVQGMLSGETEGPTIQCDAEQIEVSVSADASQLLAGVSAYDEQDGDLTGKIRIQGVSKLITDDTAKVSYIVFDSHGNFATTSRMLHYTDYSRPRFQVKEPLVYAENETIRILDRIGAQDDLDGDISGTIRISALSATSDPDVQSVTLQVTNSMGDTMRLDLPVIIHTGLVARPDVELSEYLIYLEKGDTFQAEKYLRAVQTPVGAGNKSEVQISGKVDTSTDGVYYVYYRYPYGVSTGIAVLTVVVG